jgi:hypothetical protein
MQRRAQLRGVCLSRRPLPVAELSHSRRGLVGPHLHCPAIASHIDIEDTILIFISTVRRDFICSYCEDAPAPSPSIPIINPRSSARSMALGVASDICPSLKQSSA